MAENLAGYDWNSRLNAWYYRIADFRQSSSKKIDFQWCIEADALIAISISEHKAIREAVKSGIFSPCSTEIDVTESGIRLLKHHYSKYKSIWQAIVSNKQCLARLENTTNLEAEDSKTFIASLVPGEQANARVLRYLYDFDRARAILVQREQRASRPQKNSHSSNHKPIWWAEPEPIPKVRSRLEINREQLATLPARVAQQTWQEAFGRSSLQHRSDFRRFRN